jgi:hypothetical protein
MINLKKDEFITNDRNKLKMSEKLKLEKKNLYFYSIFFITKYNK